MRYSPILVLAVALLAGCHDHDATPPVTPRNVGADRSIDAITWRHVGLHSNNDLVLRGNGTYSLIERGTYHREPGPATATQPVSYTETETSAGRWRPVAGNVLLLLKDQPDQMRGWNGYVRVYRRGNTNGFDTVASRESALDPRDDPTEWLPAPDNCLLCTRDIARYSDESEISALLGAQPYTPSTEVPQDLAATVRAQLPKGWSTTAIANALIIARDEPIQLVSTINASEHSWDDPARDNFNNTVDTRYVLVLRLGKLYTPEEVRGLLTDNAALDQRLTSMLDALRNITQKDSFVPRTDDEKRRVAAYEQLKASRKSVPTHHTQQNAVFVSEPVSWGNLIVGGAEEVASAKRKVLAFLQAY